ncbi:MULTISPECIES: FAD/NAD(P)-binding protein [Pseudoxanthomonas]|uniref:NAD(P)/FAD-binding protein YdhS n=1 Tax=Pseudoxanthomonas winnipegensis TaxID=2480810 RepID=A0AAW8GE15_9GAMM|nr:MULTISPECIES: FAD/NAD(P)-binding protein [Pseudoxanthomonas]MDQ1120700.1 putative NAD(P)/FAD-binding protein YdhS [Pseudoxanthomonas winnipegensis]MDQ1133924.1 putative NAD(P)/FAD-binding protein YdhS [Pseudoxanthomonas winnipegensis]MDR6139841.1 putative NAD(P)/FAD-binding protein YdhS [Pseudoxanthomonas sp. SORGH_AS_0997]
MSASPFDVAIVGGGAAGTLVAIQLLRQATTALRIALLEPRAMLGRGAAHATERPEHLLNVRAGGMSAFDAAPGDFVDWLQDAEPDTPRAQIAEAFVPRQRFAAYLAARLAQARADSPATLQHLPARALSLEREAEGFLLQVDGAGPVRARAVVLAIGNAPRPLPARGARSLPPARRIEAWDNASLDGIEADAAVCIVGSGLSMVDAALALLAAGHRGPLHVLSRHGLMPLPHVDGAPAQAVDVEALLALPLRARLRAVRGEVARAQAQGVPWQAVMDALRPHVQRLWTTLSGADQRRFLRHVVRLWDVHRHRIAAPVHAQLQQALARGQLQRHRARLDTAMAGARCVQLHGHGPHGEILALEVAHVINATGVELRVQAMRNPLLAELVGSGLAAPGPHGIGLDTCPNGRLRDADGQPVPGLLAIGSLRIGALWESLAIPELRGQAEVVAREALAVSGPR